MRQLRIVDRSIVRPICQTRPIVTRHRDLIAPCTRRPPQTDDAAEWRNQIGFALRHLTATLKSAQIRPDKGNRQHRKPIGSLASPARRARDSKPIRGKAEQRSRSSPPIRGRLSALHIVASGRRVTIERVL